MSPVWATWNLSRQLPREPSTRGEPLVNFIKLRSRPSDLYLPLWIEFTDSSGSGGAVP